MLDRTPLYWVILAAVNVPAFLLLGKLFFGCWGCFVESLGNAMRRGHGDFRAKLWMDVFLAICVGLVVGEAWLLGLVGGGVREASSTPAPTLVETSDRAAASAPEFLVRRDGIEFGPYPLEQLDAFRAEGRIADDDELSLVGEDLWTRAVAFRADGR